MTPHTGLPRTTRKLQRWIDLVTALISRSYGMTLAEVRAIVPGYSGRKLESVRRTFERDKDELRSLGVPIETRGMPGDTETRYLIATSEFYLPYLSVVTERGRVTPKRVDKFGYRALSHLDLTNAELELLADAVRRIQLLGDPVLEADATTALAKLAVDIPPDHLTATPNFTVMAPRCVAAGPVFEQLTEALLRRKSLTFTYYGIERDETERRVVLPYGLALTSGHWYLHAMDPSRGAVRRFRVSRMHDVTVNSRSPGSEDFAIPAHFRLASQARPVPPWELGEDPPVEVTVAFVAENGWVRTARSLGRPVAGSTEQVRYPVRRVEPFCRWLLGLAGDVTPLSPPEVVRAWRDLAQRTALVMGEST